MPGRRSSRCSAQPIEPLTGALRHPLAHRVCENEKRAAGKAQLVSDYNVTHLLVSNHCRSMCKRAARGRYLLYDLGCAQYSDHSAGTDFKIASRLAKQQNTSVADELGKFEARREQPSHQQAIVATGGSISFLRSLFRRNCIEFDHIWGWDPRPASLDSWMSRVPKSDHGKVTFFNEAVNASDESALGVLRRTARPEDYVVFKLDIDTPHIEEQILDILLASDDTTSLIDEFFFEYQPSAGPFHLDDDGDNSSKKGSVAYGMKIMGALRRRGIRAHFWV